MTCAAAMISSAGVALSLLSCADFLSICFFFYSCRYPRYLHSFPTRRSSDLRLHIVSHAAIFDGPRFGRIDRIRRKRGPSNIRSEEHTSELQSHSEIVCRLLLEKKNHMIL